MKVERNTENALSKILKLIAPGTPIREGLESILRAKTGALLLITDNSEILKEIVDGGFTINEEYTSSKLYELAKMDGAIVLSGDFKKILFANAQLIPSHQIATLETGTRHRTAERTAKQTGELVISISQRRNIITIFKGNDRYILEDTNTVLNKANQAIQTLERYKKVFDNKLNILNEYEFNDIVTLQNVITVLQRAEMVMRIAEEIEKNIAELGSDGRLVRMQLEELLGDIENEELFIIKDYMVKKRKKITAEDILKNLSELSYEDLNNENFIAKILGYDNFDNYDEIGVYTRGYRILNKIPRMPNNIVENLVSSFKSFQHILAADIENLDDVEGIGEVRARTIKQSLTRMQEQFVFDNVMF
ncbi:MAG: DNA integrity scanning diadenylate cyclase DisA [Clostridia bacterium]|nr:DNA integrity scanning diadenylate cyclase DisA [Clostridia bacterium]